MTKEVAIVNCPKAMVGRVIGKNGETIRALQNYTGAQIQIDQTTDPMKVTISGSQQSLNWAISMVTDIVNGNFKGFAMLRQLASQQSTPDADACRPLYAPGYGLIPPSQTYVGQLDALSLAPTSSQKIANTVENFTTTTTTTNSLTTLPSLQAVVAAPEDVTPSTYILGLTSGQSKLTPSPLNFNGLAPIGTSSVSQTLGSSDQKTLASLAMFNGIGNASFQDTLSPIAGASSGLSLANGSLGMMATDSSVSPSFVKNTNLNETTNLAFTELQNGGSSFSGSLSPDLSCGWSPGTVTGNEFSATLSSSSPFPIDFNSSNQFANTSGLLTMTAANALPLMPVDQDALQFHHLSNYLTKSPSKRSLSETSDSTDKQNGAGVGVAAVGSFSLLPTTCGSSGSNSVSSNNSSCKDKLMCLKDPNGRPFLVNLMTGESHWMAGISEDRGMHFNSDTLTTAAAAAAAATTFKQPLLSE